MFLVLVDLVSILAAFFLAHVGAPLLKQVLLTRVVLPPRFVQLMSPEFGEFRPMSDVAWMLLVAGAVTILVLQALGGYRPLLVQSRTRIILAVLAASLVSVGTITLVLFTLRSASWSRLFVFLFTVLSGSELAGYRLLLRWYRRKRIESGFYARSVLLIGSPGALSWLAAHVADTMSANEYDVIGYLGLSPLPLPQELTHPTSAGSKLVPCLGHVGQLSQLLVHRPVHDVIAIHGGTSEWLRGVIEACDYFRTTLRIVPEALALGELKDLKLIYHSDPLRLPEIVLRPRHLDSTALFVKRVFDILVSAALLILLAPLLALIALAIKLTTPKLPVFYPWQVVGFNGSRFTGYKFSTMVADADERRAELAAYNQMQGPVFKIRDDPRITPLGRFLRKFSLNELPQLWSVLKGDMSLVGPRPAFPHELERYELWHKRKLCVRPGITCLWQVRGRNKISKFDDWVRMDLEYIDNWSLWLDCLILLRTAWAVVAGSGS